MLFVLDDVLRAIEADIAAHPPERGGAVLGLIGRPVVTRFVFDAKAQTTSVTYRPSRWLNEQVKEVEARDGLELKGIVHSHPHALDRPSDQDEHEVRQGLALNPHITRYLVPIVTGPAVAASLDAHEIALEPEAKISFYAGIRTRDGQVCVRPVMVKEIPMRRDLEDVAACLGSATPPDIFTTEVVGREMLAGRVAIDDVELLFIVSDLYPAVPPLLLVTRTGAPTEQVQLPWQLTVPAEERLLDAVRQVFVPPGPYYRVYGPTGGPVLTHDPERARLAAWTPRYTGQNPVETAAEVRRGLFARSAGLLAEALAQRTVLIAGVGSVGSYIAEQLVRSGIGALTLIDPDFVEHPNLSRTGYNVGDVGRPKVQAAARRLLNINPLVELTLQPTSVLALAPQALDAHVRDADLVLAATDDPAAQRALNRFAYASGKPALFVGIYAGARGGEVVVTVPEQTPCYLCATASRHALTAGDDGGQGAAGGVTPPVDYGTGRLIGEVALGADIQHVSSAAIKMALALLLPDGAEARLAGFLAPALEAGLSYLTLSTEPDYWFYPHLFGETPGQFAYQSVWLTPTRRTICPVCGDPAERVDPLEVPLHSPRVTIDVASRP
jgi:molybdopterin/thiamine biosynthesis adenylyltransferase/proteasome lid subunit RPN8/RPN11